MYGSNDPEYKRMQAGLRRRFPVYYEERKQARIDTVCIAICSVCLLICVCAALGWV